MKALVAAVVLAFAPAAALAANPPELIGDWKGVLDIESNKLTIVFHVGADRVTADSPDQGALGLPAEAGTNGSALTLAIPMVGANFEGRLAPDGKTLSGVFYQGGGSPSLTLTRTSTTPTLPPAAKPTPTEIKGDWDASVQTPNGVMAIVFHLGDKPSADIPGQATGLPTTVDKTADGYKIDMMGAVFAGKLSADGKLIEGTVTQAGQSLPMKLARK